MNLHLPTKRDLQSLELPSLPDVSLPNVETTRALAATGSVMLVGLLAGAVVKYRDQIADAFNQLTSRLSRTISSTSLTTNTTTTPNGGSYEHWTKAELYERAREKDITGRSNMNKAELIAALRSA